jgi:hypothetical protein
MIEQMKHHKGFSTFPGTISITNNISNKFGQRALKKQQNANKPEDSLIIEVWNQS